ncbi:uncharacterized protein LOC113767086 isoform X1 [Coffea eugenioides]|uniref:uncharacterized protein LOC113767086 isoform X1 n=1 Tax=Coffea eugenioides TaxID=49369 RepID=UPI000F60934B|nr:uncharacterized protein LOC113767086 isoform X1 [Coffea eugenioides]
MKEQVRNQQMNCHLLSYPPRRTKGEWSSAPIRAIPPCSPPPGRFGNIFPEVANTSDESSRKVEEANKKVDRQNSIPENANGEGARQSFGVGFAFAMGRNEKRNSIACVVCFELQGCFSHLVLR